MSVDTFDDIVDISLGSDHPAAAIIEYGGYSPFPPWGPGSNVWNYGEKGDSKISPDPWHIAVFEKINHLQRRAHFYAECNARWYA